MPNSQVTITALTLADLPRMAEFAQQAYHQELGEPWTLELNLQHCQESFNPDYSLAAKIDGQLVGAVIANPVTFEKGLELMIDEIDVAVAHRGQGIGRQLMDRAVALARERGLVGVRLASNPKLRSFAWYHELGFKETGWVELAKYF